MSGNNVCLFQAVIYLLIFLEKKLSKSDKNPATCIRYRQLKILNLMLEKHFILKNYFRFKNCFLFYSMVLFVCLSILQFIFIKKAKMK